VPTLEQARTAARSGGLAAGLRLVLDGSRPVPCSAGGRALLPAGLAGSVPAWQFPGRAVPRAAAAIALRPHALAAAEGLDLVHVTERPGPDPAFAELSFAGLSVAEVTVTRLPATGSRVNGRTPAAPAPADRGPDLAGSLALAGVRIGVAQRLLEQVAAYLGRRLAGGSPLAGRQLVQGALAEAAVALELAAAAGGCASPAAAADVHRRLSEVEWSLASLFGGRGYLHDGPARCLYVTRLAADTWVTPADPGRWG
jgi:Acyl-CoA dehydrogenase, C-terminal domain